MELLTAYVPAIARPLSDVCQAIAETWIALRRHPELTGRMDVDFVKWGFPFRLWKDGRTQFLRTPLFAATVLHLFNKEAEAPFEWPLWTDLQILKRDAITIAESVATHYFVKYPELDQQLRCIFNELTLVALCDYQIESDSPDYCNISCLLTADRGPSFYSLLYLFRLKKQGKGIGSHEIRKLLTMLFCPGILTTNLPMQQAHIELFSLAASFILRQPPFRCRLKP